MGTLVDSPGRAGRRVSSSEEHPTVPWTTTLAQALDDVRVHTEGLPERGWERDGLATGFESLDRVLTGLRPGEVTVVAGLPAVGTTSFAVSIARHVVGHGRRDVVWASVDEDVPAVARNFLSAQALVTTEQLRLGALSATERARCEAAIAHLTRSSRPGQPALHGFEADCNPLDIVAGRDTTTADIARAVEALPGTDLLVVDDLKRLLYNDHAAHPDRDLDHVDALVMRELGRLATTHRLHVLATARLYRTHQRSGEPGPNDFRPFSAFHDQADNVVGVWRDDLRDDDSPECGIMRVGLLRSPGAGRWEGRLAHVLDRRLVANLARG
nr:DnaB-like helicase C-terminal domain-containing protein [Salsipaludibacter albus]